mmetsp:Transcript_29543/g.82569  ORF Transcript_29543/g.82569 Transcript_29543/m.82569 type:complete len:275 (-) Transcript_29543:643-1467(-)
MLPMRISWRPPMMTGKNTPRGLSFMKYSSSREPICKSVYLLVVLRGTFVVHGSSGTRERSVTSSWMRSRNWLPLMAEKPRYRNRPMSTAWGSEVSRSRPRIRQAPMHKWIPKPVTRCSAWPVSCSWPPSSRSVRARLLMWLRLRTVAATSHGKPSMDMAAVSTLSTSMSRWYPSPLTSLLSLEFTSRVVMFWSKNMRMETMRAGTAAPQRTHKGAAHTSTTHGRGEVGARVAGSCRKSRLTPQCAAAAVPRAAAAAMEMVGPKSARVSRKRREK